MDKDLVYKVALTQVPGIGSVLAKNVIGYCGGVKEVFEKSKTFLQKAPGVGEVISKNIKECANLETVLMKKTQKDAK